MTDNIVHIQHDMKAAMHVGSVLQTAFASVLLRLDQRNVRTLIQAVCACLSGRQLSLMALARHWPGSSRATAPLKRLDRWLSNQSVQAVRWAFYSDRSEPARAPALSGGDRGLERIAARWPLAAAVGVDRLQRPRAHAV